MTEMEIRSVEIRSVNEDTRTITGLAVPYGKPTNVGGYKEQFERGAFGDIADVKLFYGHADPIGLVTKGADTDEGYEIEARISKTPKGEEVYTLLKDGVLNRFSVGFIPVESRDEDDVVIRTKVDLKEVSVVPFPAYAGAKVSEVRAEDNTNNKEDINMSMENTNAEVADLRGAIEDIERKIALLGSEDRNEIVVPEFRSGGDFLKALASGSQEARDFATTADAGVGTTWVGGAQRLLDENRNVLNLFTKAALPASGNTIEFAAMPSVAGTVDRQVNEGDLLPYMEVQVATGSAPVYTYGGYSSLSRQAIERSDVSYLETVLRYQTLQYAKATNKVVRDNLVANAVAGDTLAADEADAWIELVIGASDSIEGNTGYAVDFVLVSSDVFLRLAKMKDTAGRPVFDVNRDGSNTWGNVSLTGRSASVAGVSVVVDSGLPANSAFAAARDAITVFESAGAPFRLQDEDILRLTKDFSLYGYLAVANTAPDAAVSLDVDLVA